MKGFHRCAIETHPMQEAIDAYLREGRNSTQINAWLVSLNYQPFSRFTISHHRTKLGIRLKNTSPVVLMPAPEQMDKTYSINEVTDMTMQEFARRLKHQPQAIGNAQLVPFLVESLRARNRQPPADPLDDILRLFAELNSGDTDSPATQEPEPAPAGTAEGVSEESSGTEETGRDPAGSEEVAAGAGEWTA